MPLKAGEIAEHEGDTIGQPLYLDSSTKDSWEPFKECIDQCESTDGCNSFAYCPPDQQGGPIGPQPQCFLKQKDPPFTGNIAQQEPTFQHPYGCVTIFKKCEKGIQHNFVPYKKDFGMFYNDGIL